jgi:hypothetical protein
MQAIVSALDEPYREMVGDIWGGLKAVAGLKQLSGAIDPHFTYHTAEQYDAAAAERVLARIAGATHPFNVTTGGIGVLRGQRHVLYLPVLANDALAASATVGGPAPTATGARRLRTVLGAPYHARRRPHRRGADAPGPPVPRNCDTRWNLPVANLLRSRHVVRRAWRACCRRGLTCALSPVQHAPMHPPRPAPPSLRAAFAGGGGKPAALIIYEANTAGVVNIFTIDPTTAASKQITHGDAFDGNPAWSPDRKHIIFSSNRNQEDVRMNEILVMDADGRNVRNLTNTEKGSEWSPKYSPDGARISYAITTGDGAYHLGLMDADGSNPQEIAGPYRFVEFPSWTRRTRVFFSASRMSNDVDIYSINVATKEVRTRISTAADLCPTSRRQGATYATVDPAQTTAATSTSSALPHPATPPRATSASPTRTAAATSRQPSPDDRASSSSPTATATLSCTLWTPAARTRAASRTPPTRARMCRISGEL